MQSNYTQCINWLLAQFLHSYRTSNANCFIVFQVEICFSLFASEIEWNVPFSFCGCNLNPSNTCLMWKLNKITQITKSAFFIVCTQKMSSYSKQIKRIRHFEAGSRARHIFFTMNVKNFANQSIDALETLFVTLFFYKKSFDKRSTSNHESHPKNEWKFPVQNAYVLTDKRVSSEEKKNKIWKTRKKNNENIIVISEENHVSGHSVSIFT